MTLAPGRTLLHYRLVEQIGEGGMGVVWKATDTTLDREVAIKILPEVFSADPDRLARFEREAKLLASLNHPNIAAIYGLHQAQPAAGEKSGVNFLAMELVPGHDLSQRLTQGAMPMEQALDTARQVAEALEAAHERGVVHRDLKPANIQIGPDGKVKVLDFGLAKALDTDTASGPADLSHSPTLTSAGTMAGVIMGTAAYMSPEQARGKSVDRRSDLWSFGCVVYEMLTGRPAFGGETVTDVLSAVISREPDREALPSTTPPSVRRMLDRCMAKDVRRRLSDASDARLEIEDADREAPPGTHAAPDAAQRQKSSILPWALAVVAILVAAAAWILRPDAGGAETSGAPAVVAIEGLTSRAGPEFMPALSPNGRNLAYVARDGDDLDIFLVRVGGENAINLTADHDAWDGAPAFSPDGEKIAFASEREGGGLFVMGATGESPRRVADEGTHPSWSPDGTRLVAATEQVNDPYSRSTRSRVFIVDLETGETRDLPVIEDGVGPRWSPDGRHIAYWNEIDGQRDLWTIAVDGGDPVRLTEDPETDWEPMWAEGGHAVYFHSDRGGNADLWRIPIDPSTGGPSGPLTPLTIGVMPVWESSISADGTRLVGTMRDTSSALVAYPFDLNRQQVVGEPETLLELSDNLRQPTMSPDGRSVVFRTSRAGETVTTYELESGVQRSLTEDAFRNRGTAWSPDGEWIAMYSNRSGPYQLWLMRPDGTDVHRIFEPSASDPTWSPDSRRLAAAVDSGTRWGATAFFDRKSGASSGVTEWVDSGVRVENFSPEDWSPDGRLMLGQAGDLDLTLGIYEIDAAEVRTYADPPPASDYENAWVSDSERVLYWDPVRFNTAIWNTRTGVQTPLPDVKGPGSPFMSPDGRTLYVLEKRVDGDVWMLTLQR